MREDFKFTTDRRRRQRERWEWLKNMDEGIGERDRIRGEGK